MNKEWSREEHLPKQFFTGCLSVNHHSLFPIIEKFNTLFTRLPHLQFCINLKMLSKNF